MKQGESMAASIALRASARAAGWSYLVMGLSAAVDLAVIRGRIIVPSDAAATIQRLAADNLLFRAGMTLEVVSSIGAVLTITFLYRLFRGVDATLARLMALLLLVSIPITLGNVIVGMVATSLLGAPGSDATITALLTAQRSGFMVAQFFWGLWLLPLGLLILRSRPIPRVIGALLIAAGMAYVATSLAWMLWPPLARPLALVGAVPEFFGELSLILWLIAKAPIIVPRREPSMERQDDDDSK